MKYKFEFEKIKVCGDCPIWCPNIMPPRSHDGFCGIDQVDRDRFDDRPADCPIESEGNV